MLLPSHCLAESNAFHCFSNKYNRLYLVRQGTTYELGLSVLNMNLTVLKVFMEIFFYRFFSALWKHSIGQIVLESHEDRHLPSLTLRILVYLRLERTNEGRKHKILTVLEHSFAAELWLMTNS